MGEQLKLFWRSLRNHPGLIWTWLWPLMVAVAVVSRKDFTSLSDVTMVVAVNGALALLPWLPILWTAWTMRHQYKEQDNA